MKLQDLPHLTITSIETGSPDVVLRGHIAPLTGVRLGRSWLYSQTHPLIGDLTSLGPDGDATFVAPYWAESSPAQVGASLPWIDGYWQATQVSMILDPEAGWRKTRFAPSPAQYFRLDGVTGSQQVGSPLPAGAIPLHIDQAGWDHEHCELCGDKIGAGGIAEAYVDREDHWMCPPCYERYALTGDLSFLVAT